MKHIFTLFLMGLACIGMSQTLSVESPTADLQLGDYLDYGSTPITNTGDTAIELAIQLERECYVPGDDTRIQICMGALCFASVDDDRIWDQNSDGSALSVIEPGAVWSDFKFDPLPDSSMGYGSAWIVTFFDRNDTSNSVSIEVNIGDVAECSALSVDELENANVLGNAFPNPVNDELYIPFNTTSSESSIVIYNCTGAVQETIDLIGKTGDVKVNTADYASGIYFYRLSSNSGDLSNGKSFIK